jgi:hypothetical protein
MCRKKDACGLLPISFMLNTVDLVEPAIAARLSGGDKTLLEGGLRSDDAAAPAPDTRSDLQKYLYKLFGFTYYDEIFDLKEPIAPQMYKIHNVGLYAHYAALGLVYAIAGLCYNFCYYVYDGSDNVCANAQSLIFVPWGLKIFFAMFTDSYRPFGTRRKVYIIGSWVLVMLLCLILALCANELSVGAWIGVSIFMQALLMIADVPADGYSVEIGQLEGEAERGMVLSNGQKYRFAFTVLGGFIQAVLVNGPTTNDSDCNIAIQSCWSWGLTVQQYYALIFVILFFLMIPIFFLREIDPKTIPHHTLREHSLELWQTLKNPTTMYLMIFVAGNGLFSNMAPITTTYVQYILIELTNFQSGITAIVTYCAVFAGIAIFQRFFIQRNWRMTLYLSITLNQIVGLLWILVYHDTGNLLDPWFTIFITLNQYVAQGISQVLFSMAVIELARPGQEAITFELIISVANSASQLSTIIATQLLHPLGATTCSSNYVDDDSCQSHQVNLNDENTYDETNGPRKFTNYQLVVLSVNIISMFIFTQFLPRQKDECQSWKELGESGKFFLSPSKVGWVSATIAVLILLYQMICTAILLNPATSCLPAFGGSGC